MSIDKVMLYHNEDDREIGSSEPQPSVTRGKLRNACGLNTIIGCLVVLNAIFIGLSCDIAPEWLGWLIFDTIFAVIFTVEILYKLRYVGVRQFTFSGEEAAWNVTETAIVFVALLEVLLQWFIMGAAGSGFSSVFRTCRMLRVTRVARVMRLEAFQELTILVKGMLGGLRVLAWSMILLFLPLYSAAVVCREMDSGGEDGPLSSRHAVNSILFGSIGASLHTVFRCVMVGDCVDENGQPLLIYVTRQYGWGYGLFFAMLIIFVTLGLFNVIAAIFVEQVIVGAKTSGMLMRRQRLRDKAFLANKLAELLQLVIDMQGNHRASRNERRMTLIEVLERAKEISITSEEFDKLRTEARFNEILSELDVPDEDQFNLFETLDVNGDNRIDLEEFVDGIARLRGDPRRGDIVNLTFMVKSLQAGMHDLQVRIVDGAVACEGAPKEVRAEECRSEASLCKGKPTFDPVDFECASQG